MKTYTKTKDECAAEADRVVALVKLDTSIKTSDPLYRSKLCNYAQNAIDITDFTFSGDWHVVAEMVTDRIYG